VSLLLLNLFLDKTRAELCKRMSENISGGLGGEGLRTLFGCCRRQKIEQLGMIMHQAFVTMVFYFSSNNLKIAFSSPPFTEKRAYMLFLL